MNEKILPKVLLVEENRELALELPGLLSRMGMEVDVATSGAAALVSLHKCLPDLIIASGQISSHDGGCLIEGLEKLKLTGNIPVVVTGGDADKLSNKGVFLRSAPYDLDEFARFVYSIV